MKQEEGKTHGYTWEFFKERIELEFNPKKSNYISRCKFHDHVNAINDNLCQYVMAYSKLALEIWHIHELDQVCHFMMGLPTWAKCKLEENWAASLWMWDRAKNSGSKRRTNYLTRRHAMKGNGTESKTSQKGKSPNNSKAQISNPKEILSRRGFL